MAFVLYQHDPAHSFGSVSAEGVTVQLVRTFSCAECLLPFPSERALSEHIGTAHPIHLPYLTLGGRQLSSAWTLRQRPSAQLAAVNAETISVHFNDRPLPNGSVALISRLLADNREGVIDVRLANRAVESVYRILLRVPDPAQIEEITSTFSAQLARNDVSVRDVRRFADALHVSEASLDYASGLADYVYGVLAKDGSGGVSLPFSAFREKFLRARAVLGEFDDPLANAVCSAIKFNLNDFGGPHVSTGVDSLDLAIRYFAARVVGSQRPVATKRVRQPKATPHALCPIDGSTEWLLRLASGRDAIDATSIPFGLSDEDQTKAFVLIADKMKQDHVSDAAQYLRQLQHDPVFGGWALSLLNASHD